ncbi:MAG: helix-turn-helix transcriptional regulator [Candidatus Brevundimonas colombiensis]|uniref:Helix-turn-helix transcriptional regulator n=1 Tax=Candidatus Brevundimonas colombiensis TaxID=3121376 RepID=A0AAJ6BK62_9CAUL|nr:helix-turn-helix transcriptional regulator [Brevundimonas sp.]WEK40595.1 MAG: helix-turn-helix transcriptional regulator [Brevundimonas sp.]
MVNRRRNPFPRAAEPVDVFVGAQIAARRMALGLSQSALGDQVGVSFQQMQKYESGRNRISASRLHGLAVALGAPVQAFFPQRVEPSHDPDVALVHAVCATAEGRTLALSFARMESRAVRQAVTQLVEVLAKAA